jgi:ribonuclease HI
MVEPPATPTLLVAYTDGSCTRAHLPSGAGVVIYDGDPEILGWGEGGAQPIVEASRELGNGTNNHAELSGLRIALWLTDDPPAEASSGQMGLRHLPLIIRTDSEYAQGAVTSPELAPWTAPNARLIYTIKTLMKGRRVRIEHVDAHKGNPGNERADELAGMARKRIIEDRKKKKEEG